MEPLNDVHVLIRWGLTLNQAKTYLALLKLGLSKIMTISKNVDIATGDVYRIMAVLEEIGLVEKVISAPIKYKAVPMGEAVSILKRRRIEENFRLEAVTKKMLKKFDNIPETSSYNDWQQFVLFSETRAFLKRKKTLEKVQESLDLITSLEKPNTILYNDSEEIAKAVQRGVKIRIIIKNPQEKLPPEITNLSEKNPAFEIRYIRKPPSMLIGIYDKIEASVLTGNPEMKKCATLWIENPYVLSIIQDYFERIWSTDAVENKEIKCQISTNTSKKLREKSH